MQFLHRLQKVNELGESLATSRLTPCGACRLRVE